MKILTPALLTHLGLVMVGLTEAEKHEHVKWMIDFVCERYSHQFRDHCMDLFGDQWRIT